MRIGVPREIKTNENRVALVPVGAETLVERERIATASEASSSRCW